MLYCVGAGVKAAHLPLGAHDMLPLAHWVLQSARMPLYGYMSARGLDAQTLDELYEKCLDYDELNAAIAETLIRASMDKDVVYAAIGAGVYGELLERIRVCAHKAGVGVEVIPGVGYAVAASAKAGRQWGFTSYRTLEASGIANNRQDASLPIAIEEVSNAYLASDVKLWLLETYRDDFELVYARADALGEYAVKRICVGEIDKQEFDHTSVLLIPPCEFQHQGRWGADGLEAVVARLRAPDGCPWDREQTHESLKICLLEECYEVLDAIDSGGPGELCEELGDLMLQALMHAQIAGEVGDFTIRDVTSGICEKLIYRHPHVFADVKAETSGEVLRNWDQLKMAEKKQQTNADALKSVPRNLPALLRAKKVQHKAARVGFDWTEAKSALEKVAEETLELKAELDGGGNVAAELGDLLFSVVNVARLSGVEPEFALNQTSDRFIERFELMEKLVAKDKKALGEMRLDEMDEYWEKAKRMLTSKRP